MRNARPLEDAAQVEDYLDKVAREKCFDMAPAARDRWMAGPAGPINEVDERGFAPLHVAAVSGNARAVEVLVERGALLEATTKPQGWRALHLAASAGAADAVEVLLDAGAEAARRLRRGRGDAAAATWTFSVESEFGRDRRAPQVPRAARVGHDGSRKYELAPVDVVGAPSHVVPPLRPAPEPPHERRTRLFHEFHYDDSRRRVLSAGRRELRLRARHVWSVGRLPARLR